MSGQIILMIAKNGTIVVGQSGTAAGVALMQRLSYSVASGEALAVGITVGTNGAITATEIGLTGQDAKEFAESWLGGDTPEAAKILYAALAGLVLGAGAGAGIGAFAFGLAAGAAYTQVFTWAYNWSSQQDWNKALDPLYEFIDMLSEQLGKVYDEVKSWFDSAQAAVFRRDPLTFDLDGDGLETVSEELSEVVQQDIECAASY